MTQAWTWQIKSYNMFIVMNVISDAAGSEPEDHEQFETHEEGVRAHFNHISAYVGLTPIGEPHGRYHLVTLIS